MTRARSEDDNRVVNVRLTDTGRTIAQNTPLSGIALLRRRLDYAARRPLQQVDEVWSDLVELMEVTDSE